MIGKIKRGLKKRRVKIFLVFLLCSTLAWVINTLSKTHQHSTVLELNYTNIPNDLLLVSTSHKRVKVKLSGVGFQFLKYGMLGKQVKIDLSAMNSEGKYFLTQKEYQQQIENQLSKPMELLAIENDTFFFDFQDLVSKRIPVRLDIDFSLAKNHMLDGSLLVQPDSITVNGLHEEIDTLKSVSSAKVDLKEVAADFSIKAELMKSDALKHTNFSNKSITVSGKVFKFSEKNITVTIRPINLPNERNIKMFPNTVQILCKGNLEILKTLKPSDFRVVADYRAMGDAQLKFLPISLIDKPVALHSAILKNTEVEYILENKE